MSAVATEASQATAPAEPVPHLGTWDWWVCGAALGLAAFGLLMILSASSLGADARYGDALHFVTRQSAGLLAGALVGLGVLRAPWSRLRQAAWPVYGLSLVGLVLVLTPLGYSANGATRWIAFGPVNAQPSEFAKLALILVMAHYLACNEGRLRDFMGVVVPALALPVPLLLLVMLQPDFGTTVLLVGLAGTLVFLAGLEWWLVACGAVSGAAGLAGVAVLESYRIRRLTSFLDPFADEEGAGYQVVQGWIALASGGATGRGLAAGVAQSGFLPEAHTDFISAVVGEELGAVGWVLMTGAYVVLVWRGSLIAARATDLFGMLVAQGITVLLAGQAIINLGVVVGWMPAKGLVLPFLSYGSSAVLVHVLCVALLLRISMENRAAGADGRSPGALEGEGVS